MSKLSLIVIVFVYCCQTCRASDVQTSNDLLYKVVNECFHKGYSKCIKQNVLHYLDNQFQDGVSSRNMNLNEVDSNEQPDDETSLDEKILQRVQRYLLSHQFVIESPELMKDAAIVYSPAQDPSDFNVVYRTPEQEQGRELTGSPRQDQEKTLMPLVMMLKMKMKMLMPIMMMLIGMKATKALVLSKLSIIIVIVFMVMQMLSKKGMMPMNMMAMPMAMPPSAESATPPSSYGVASSMTTSSYDPAANWEANSGGPYSRVWDSTHSSAYSAYKPTYSTSYSSGTSSGGLGVGVASSYQSSSY